MKPQPAGDTPGIYADLYNHGPEWAFWLPDNRMTEPRTWRCPYGQPGDRLWVRETHALNVPGCDDGVSYRADHNDPRGDGPAHPMEWRPSIHMKREHSRINLEVTGVRVERVQDITEADARAEGVTADDEPRGGAYWVTKFARLWDSINAKRGYSWESNPWVWVVEFKTEAP